MPGDNLSSTTGQSEEGRKGRRTLSGIIHYAVFGLLLAGGLAYWAMKPPSVNPMADPRAAEAMALVQTHKARNAPTLRQAMTQRVQGIASRGQGVRLGEWRVERQTDDIYLVKIDVREQGSRQWFEREYVWRVDLNRRSVAPLSMPAEDLMPFGETGPLTDGDRPAR